MMGEKKSRVCVLVVDDDRHVLDFTAQCLRLHGYVVVPALSASEAVERFGSAEPAIDILLTDVVMPGMFGDQLALELRRLNPALKVIFMSGNPAEAIRFSEPIEPGWNYLQKPFSIQELRDCVSRHCAAPLPVPVRGL